MDIFAVRPRSKEPLAEIEILEPLVAVRMRPHLYIGRDYNSPEVMNVLLRQTLCLAVDGALWLSRDA